MPIELQRKLLTDKSMLASGLFGSRAFSVNVPCAKCRFVSTPVLMVKSPISTVVLSSLHRSKCQRKRQVKSIFTPSARNGQLK